VVVGGRSLFGRQVTLDGRDRFGHFDRRSGFPTRDRLAVCLFRFCNENLWLLIAIWRNIHTTKKYKGRGRKNRLSTGWGTQVYGNAEHNRSRKCHN